jgi:ubiquinone/menaquinone biosynthesis C-methylase UbiE
MTANSVDQVRSDYDRLAAEYARRLYGELTGKPRDRDLLLRFAADVAKRSEVCDLGCGPGHVARFLADAGVRIFGLDLSPEMLAQARRLNPDLEFREGNMLSLPLADNTLAGMTAFYAIVNIPLESLPLAFREIQRVLQPGGLLLLAFHIGGDIIRPEEMWGTKVQMEFYHFARPLIERMLNEAEFHIEEVVERGPYAPEVEYQSRRAYVFARKPYRETNVGAPS